MDLEITPEPTPEERAAIEEAVAGLLAASTPAPTAWWVAGVADVADDEATAAFSSLQSP